MKSGRLFRQKQGQRSSLLVVSNCQTLPIGRGLSRLNLYESVGEISYLGGFEKVDAKIKSFDSPVTLVTSIEESVCNELVRDNATKIERVLKIPEIYFPAFHPDQSYVQLVGGEILKSPIGDYHSKMALYGFMSGLNLDRCQKLYSENVYEKIGYFDTWTDSILKIENRFLSSDLSFDSFRPFLSGHEIFMNSFNHPNAKVIHALTLEICTELDILSTELKSPKPSDLHDYLTGPGLVYPLFPEIASIFGQEGDYVFYTENGKQLSLDRFIEESYLIYSSRFSELRKEEHYFSEQFLAGMRVN
jgi:hypothetical protein